MAVSISGTEGVKLPNDAGFNTSSGKVLQTLLVTAPAETVVFSQTQGVYSTFASFTITPTSASSKIVIIGTAQIEVQGGNYPCVNKRLLRNGTPVEEVILRGYEGDENNHTIFGSSTTIFDEPATTSPVSYEMQGANSSGSYYSGTYGGRANAYEPSRFLVMEVAA